MSDEQHVRLTGNLADTFSILRFRGTEELGRLFDFTLDLLATSESIDFPDVLGTRLTVSLRLEEGERHFDGCVVSFAQVGRRGRRALYRARIRPWLWYLTRTRDCRIFQHMSVPEILADLFQEHGHSDFEDTLSRDYAAREFCVQYRESDFDFISRLMEEEGIYYFFRHDEDKHVLVLVDAPSCHERIEGCEEVAYWPPGSDRSRAGDHVWDWWLGQTIQTELYALRDYDFENPRNPPEAKETRARDHQGGSFEAYDYPGRFLDAERGRQLATNRVEEAQAQFERVRAIGNLRGVTAGGLFALTNHPRDDQNREYLVIRASFDARAAEYESGTEAGGGSFECELLAMFSETEFRPERLTPRPVVQGPQTATVVGPDGERVWTDEYGRVRCQFHWDREGAQDENSSCWVRVSQISAGNRWGSVFMPHIGQEVIVSFLEGDPDRPIVVGRVYNADNMPPYELPDHQYRSVIRDHYGNQIMLNGEPGKEGISIFSPSHRSEMILGRSFQRVSDSDDWEKTYGDSYKVTFGRSVDFSLGSFLSGKAGIDASVFAGFKVGFTLAADISIAASMRGNITLGPEFKGQAVTTYTAGKAKELKYTKDTYRQDSEKDIIMDAKGTAFFGGGKGSGDRTMLQSDKTSVRMVHGQEFSPATASDKLAWGLLAGSVASAVAGVGTIIGGVSAMEADLMSEEAQDTSADRCDGASVYKSDGVAMKELGAGVGATAAACGLASVGFLLGSLRSWKTAPVPGIVTPTARVSVSREQVMLESLGTGLDISMVRLQPTEIEVSNHGDIKVDTGGMGTVSIDNVVDVSKQKGTVHIKSGKVVHKNLTILE